MSDLVLAALLMVCGLSPGVTALVASLRLQRRGTPAVEETFQRWLEAGYIYVAIFIVAGFALSFGAETGVWVAGPLWVGLPTFVSLLGLNLLATEQQRLREALPTPEQLESDATQLRLETQRLSAALSQDLGRLMTTQSRLAARGAMALRARQYTLLERLGGRLRSLIKQLHEQSTALSQVLRGVRALKDSDALSPSALADARAAFAGIREALVPLRAASAAHRAEVENEIARLKWLD